MFLSDAKIYPAAIKSDQETFLLERGFSEIWKQFKQILYLFITSNY